MWRVTSIKLRTRNRKTHRLARNQAHFHLLHPWLLIQLIRQAVLQPQQVHLHTHETAMGALRGPGNRLTARIELVIH